MAEGECAGHDKWTGLDVDRGGLLRLSKLGRDQKVYIHLLFGGKHGLPLTLKEASSRAAVHILMIWRKAWAPMSKEGFKSCSRAHTYGLEENMGCRSC